jgi:hypothetical protein
MIWRRRCLVLVPVLSFLAAALIMSCGGGGSSSTTTVGNPFAIIGLNVCPGTPPVPTPKPSPTKSKTPTPTPTPECSPVSAATVGTAPGSNTVQFNAQGIFNRNNDLKTAKFHDVTNSDSTQWNPIAPTATFPGVISYSSNGNGLFIGVIPGCTYFTVSDGGFTQIVVVGVNPFTSPCPTPPAIPVKPPAAPQP